MPRYKNCSGSSYQFYGVVFHPSDVHDVPGSISHKKFIVTNEPETPIADSKDIDISVNVEPEHIDSEKNAIQQLLSNDADTATNEGTKRGKRSPKGE